MRTQIVHLHARTLTWHSFVLELFVAAVLVIVIFIDPVSALRLQERGLYINSSEAGATTFYRISWRYMSANPIGSVELLFCMDPIPYHPCEAPLGMDVSGVTLTHQTGETNFSISEQSQNRLVISRPSQAPLDPRSSYTFDNVINPITTDQAFSIRLKTFTSSDATGPQVDFGSVRGQTTPEIQISTQVPPMLIFCLAQQVSDNCASTNDIYYTNMGELSETSTLTAQSQMAVGTNATAGFVIMTSGSPLSAGTNTIATLSEPTVSQQGSDQFGINLVANTAPEVGRDPEGAWANAVTSDDYGQPDKYKFESGDVVAYSPNVSLMKKFTVSYIVNASETLPPGVYSTTINFIASGRF